MAGSKAPLIEIQPLTTNHQFREAVALQKAIWGFDEIELLPVRLFVTATKVGGQAFGAFHSGRMVAFCLSIPGLKQGSKPYLHSHMLGVLPEFRDSGIGRRLKLRQREDALAHRMGISGVPTFIFENKYMISGAQDAETIAGVMDKVAEKLPQAEEAEA